MTIVQLEKTLDTVVARIETEDLYFLKLEKIPSRNNGRTIRRFHSLYLKHLPFDEILSIINDDAYILIKIEEP